MASAIEPVAFMQRVLENFRPSLISEFRVLENNCPPIFSWKMILLYYRRMLRYMLFFFLNLSWKFWKSIFSRMTRLDIDNRQYYYSRVEFHVEDILCNNYSNVRDESWNSKYFLCSLKKKSLELGNFNFAMKKQTIFVKLLTNRWRMISGGDLIFFKCYLISIVSYRTLFRALLFPRQVTISALITCLDSVRALFV